MVGVLELAAPQSRNRCAIRLIQENDIPWMLDLSARRYSNRYDLRAAEMWFRHTCLKQPTVFLPIRSDGAFLVTLISVLPWLPSEWEANMVHLCAEEGCMWEAIALVREGIAWAKRRRCTEFRMASETAFDLAPIAARLGMKRLIPRYSLRLAE